MHPSVERLRAAGLARSEADAELVGAVREVVEAVRARELDRRGLQGDEPAAGSREVARGVRRVAVGEVEVAVGLSAGEARTLVRAATAPGEVYGMVREGLCRGEVSWTLVREMFDKTGPLEADQQVLVAAALMGTDARVAAADRLDPEGELHGRPWSVPRFRAALDAEVAACRGTDPAAERAARARAYEARRLSVRVHQDGTATLHVRGPVAPVVAAGDRVERAARALRALGDPRTLDQLRVDIALGLLIYATVALGDGKDVNPAPEESPTDHGPDGTAGTDARGAGEATDGASGGRCGQDALFDELLAPEDMEALARVVNALPPVALQVVVPWATLAGGFPVCAHCGGPLDATDPQAGPGSRGHGHGHGGGCGGEPQPRGPGEGSARDPSPDDRAGPGAGQDCARDPGAPEDSAFHRQDRAGRRGGRGGIGVVLGPNPFFVSDGHARELALMPGTVLHRLVVDPRDGRLVERTIKGYRPDADMRRQVVAADVYSRAPGARVPASAGELDHVTPYGWAGGPTSEANLALLAKRPHQYKTDGQWHVEIGARRDLTFTTLLGQIATTRVHDYRTYLDRRHPEDADARRDLAGQLLQAALADRARSRGRRRDDWLTMDHTDHDTGARRPGPRPDQPTLEELIDRGDGDDGERGGP